MTSFAQPCYNNINSRQKSHTFQHHEVPRSKNFIMTKYFESQAASAQTNYANVSDNIDQSPPPFMPTAATALTSAAGALPGADPTHLTAHSGANHHSGSHHNHHQRQASQASRHSRLPPPHHSQQHFHNRSLSHVYSTMQHHHAHPHQFHPSVNDPALYYNLNGLIQQHQQLPPPPAPPQAMPARAQHSPPPPLNPPAVLDCITVMQVCNELGNNIDSSPPMPSSRKYTIIATQSGYFKVAFPQERIMKKNFRDPQSGLTIEAGQTISVLGPSKEDRSKFTICYKNRCIDVQHQYTQLQAM